MKTFKIGKRYIGKANYLPFGKGIFKCDEIDQNGDCWTHRDIDGSDIKVHIAGDLEDLNDGTIVPVMNAEEGEKEGYCLAQVRYNHWPNGDLLVD